MASSALREELNCPICLDLYTEPVMLKCGHNFCQACIVSVLDTQRFGVYSCPECRAEYTERPPLEKYRKLCNIVDNFRSAFKEQTEVFCTYCDPHVLATKTCLLCEASFCSRHLSNHSKSADHIFTEPTRSFEDRKCSTHQEILKYYCTEDKACICMSCWVAGDHKGHQVDLLNEASEKKKEKLKDVTKKLNNERQETEKIIQNLENHRKEEKGKATKITGRVTDLFRDIRKHVDDVEKRVLTEISRQEEKISQSISDLIRQLETQKDELSRKIKEMEDLHKTTDPLTVLKKGLISDDIIPRSGDVRDAGCLNEGIISQMLHRELLHFTVSLKDMRIKRQFSVMEKSDIFLDIKTASNYIIISQDMKLATDTKKPESRPNVPERFVSRQVLSRRSFSSGRHYWQVDVSGAKEWLVGVAAQSMERKIDGNESYIGYNDKSWGLTQRVKVQAVHNNIFKVIDTKPPIKLIGISLDYDIGYLTFYKLCDPIRHLHTFTTTFTQPLYAAFFLFEDSSIRIM
ncbi:E3 ubiquitin/ISG15 ligase TRIM25-like [Mantella aurantiaca]